MADTNGTFPNLVIDIGQSSQRPTSAATSPLAQRVEGTLREVLAWRPRGGDSKSFVAALNQAFTIREKQGHTEWEWTPRSYAIQADMGAVTGAQASIYARAKSALDQSRPLLEGLYPLRSDADREDADAIRALVLAQLDELVGELGKVGGPRVQRIDGLFDALLGAAFDISSVADDVEGLLGVMAERFGFEVDQVNTIDEEQNLTNFLIVLDHTTGLFRSWDGLRRFFDNQGSDVFLGTQLVLLSRILDVITESVQELQFVMDSVFVGAGERQVVRLSSGLTIDELLSWIDRFTSQEAKQIIRDAGKDGVVALQPTLATLFGLVQEARVQSQSSSNNPRPGFHTARVATSILELEQHLDDAVELANQLRRNALRVSSVFPPTLIIGESPQQLIVNGHGFEPGAGVNLINATNSVAVPPSDVLVVSGERLFATLRPGSLTTGLWNVQVENSDDEVSDPVGELVVEARAALPTPPVNDFLLDPATGRQGETPTVIVSRQSGLRFSEADRVFFDEDIQVLSRSLTGDGNLAVAIDIADDADVGGHDVFVITGGSTVLLEDAFSVTPGSDGDSPALPVPPVLGRFTIAPLSGAQGVTNLEVTITKEGGAAFADGDMVSFGKGIRLSDFKVTDGSTIVAMIDIAPDAAVREHTIFVTVAGEPVKIDGGFSVTPGNSTSVEALVVARALLVNNNNPDPQRRIKAPITSTGFSARTAVKQGDGVDGVELELDRELMAGTLPEGQVTLRLMPPGTTVVPTDMEIEAVAQGRIITVRLKGKPTNFPIGQYTLTLHKIRPMPATGPTDSSDIVVTFAVTEK